MTDSVASSTANYFADDTGSTAFNEAFNKLVSRLHQEIVSKYVRPENTLRLHHGRILEHPGSPQAVDGGIQEFSAVTETAFQAIVDNDLSEIDRVLTNLAHSMQQGVATMMYSTIDKACNKTGNVIDARALGSLEDAFIGMIEKIEFVADRNGNVKLPELHTSPETGKKMIDALEAASPEFRERIEALKARKIAEAQEREDKRKARFVRYGDHS